ncbi:MAG: hypothetical protein ACK5XV_04600 [Flavobacteriales bacterium]|jgi:hypothetical protein
MEKTTRFFVHFWLAATLAAFIYAFYRIYLNGWEREKNNLFMAGLVLIWYLFRRAMYRRMKRNSISGE